jgi:S-adenosylmethionine hydrolase
VHPTEFGPAIRDAIKPEFATVTRGKGMLIGEVLHVDSFGNIITNIGEKETAQLHTKDVVNVEFSNQKLKLKLCKTYDEAKPQEPIALIGSHNYLELAINQGNAAEKFKVNVGDKIKVSFA